MIEWKAPDGKRSARKQGSPEQETGCGEAAKAREKGVYYLQFSSKTEEEMRRKLAEQGFSPASVDSAVKFLKERRYLNDEDYARRYLEKNGKTIKVCTNCTFPHQPENYDKVIAVLKHQL